MNPHHPSAQRHALKRNALPACEPIGSHARTPGPTPLRG